MPTKSAATKRAPKPAPMDILKRAIAKAIAREIKDAGITQVEAARVMRDSPSQVSLIVSGKLRGFSPSRLLTLLARLGRDVRITTAPASKGKQGRIRYQ